MTIILIFIFCVKIVSGVSSVEPRVWNSPPPVGKYENDVITIPKEETMPYSTFEKEVLNKGAKTDEEIDHMVEKQNDCLTKFNKLEC